MNHQQGTASSPADLLSKLATFAAANGWTVQTPTSGSVFSKGNVFAGLLAQSTTLDTRGCLSYSSGSAWNAQPNNSGVTHQCNLGAGPYTSYDFYEGDDDASKDLLAAIIEISAGVFRHWVLCDLVKAGAYTGGTYTDSVNWNAGGTAASFPESSLHRVVADANGTSLRHGHAWCDYDSKSNNWQPVGAASDNETTRLLGTVRNTGILSALYDIGYARYNERTVPDPISIYANRASNLRSRIGRIPAMRLFNLTNHAAGDLVDIGTDTWQVFPICARNSVTNSNGAPASSGMYGYGYLR